MILKVKGSGTGVARKREAQKLTNEERLEKRKAILAALAKASRDSELLEGNAGLPAGEPQEYYTLSHDEIEALVNGNMAKIETWVSNLDRNHATRLLRWLIKERW
jgi:HD superfamily phosphodiesterase